MTLFWIAMWILIFIVVVFMYVLCENLIKSIKLKKELKVIEDEVEVITAGIEAKEAEQKKMKLFMKVYPEE